MVSELIDQPQQRPFDLFVADTTPHPRPYAKTLAERGYIYQPNTIKGNKPINVSRPKTFLEDLPALQKSEDTPSAEIIAESTF